MSGGIGWKDGGVGWKDPIGWKSTEEEDHHQGTGQMPDLLAADRGDDADRECEPRSSGEVVGGPQGLREDTGAGTGPADGTLRYDAATRHWIAYVRYTGGQAQEDNPR